MKSFKLQYIALLLILVFSGSMISSSFTSIDECLIAEMICMAMESYARYICSLPGPRDPRLCKAAKIAAAEACLEAAIVCSGGCS